MLDIWILFALQFRPFLVKAINEILQELMSMLCSSQTYFKQ